MYYEAILIFISVYSNYEIYACILYNINYAFNYQIGKDNELLGVNRVIVPFIACGDLNGFDSDMSYPLKVYN